MKVFRHRIFTLNILILYLLYPSSSNLTQQMTSETKNLFIEVTGESQPTCKKVMDALLHSMLKQGLGTGSVQVKKDSESGTDVIVKPHLLTVEPVKVVDPEGKLYVVYPSRVDLLFEDINVTRDS